MTHSDLTIQLIQYSYLIHVILNSENSNNSFRLTWDIGQMKYDGMRFSSSTDPQDEGEADVALPLMDSSALIVSVSWCWRFSLCSVAFWNSSLTSSCRTLSCWNSCSIFERHSSASLRCWTWFKCKSSDVLACRNQSTIHFMIDELTTCELCKCLHQTLTIAQELCKNKRCIRRMCNMWTLESK